MAWQDRPLGACAQDFCASQSKSRPGGGAERVWSPVGVLAVRGVLGMWEAWRCQ